MPSRYTFDNSVPDANSAYYSASPDPRVTAFHAKAPKSSYLKLEPRVPTDTHTIYMPRREDHGWGNHNARFKVLTKRATPFNNIFKGDPKTQFTLSVGTLGRTSTDFEAEPRTDFAVRIKRIMDYLATVSPGATLAMAALGHIYANINRRMPSSHEIEKIVAVEALMNNYLRTVPTAPTPSVNSSANPSVEVQAALGS
jgi:hypothetical protein